MSRMHNRFHFFVNKYEFETGKLLKFSFIEIDNFILRLQGYTMKTFFIRKNSLSARNKFKLFLFLSHFYYTAVYSEVQIQYDSLVI